MELRKVLKFIFTVENKYCYATKYKIIKILGIDIPVYKKTSFNGNRVFIIKNGIKTPIREKLTGLDIEFGDKSRNNTIIIEKPIHFIESKIICNGTNALINIASSQHNIKRLLIRCSSEKSNAFVNIDKNFFVIFF